MARKSVWQELRHLKKRLQSIEEQRMELDADNRRLIQLNEMLQIRNGQLCEELAKLRLGATK